MSAAETTITVINLPPAPIIEVHSTAPATFNKDSLEMGFSVIPVMVRSLLTTLMTSIQPSREYDSENYSDRQHM